MTDSTPALFQTERQRAIAELVVSSGRMEVSELADRFKVTTETIRRDLSELQNSRLVRRVHGGAIPWDVGHRVEPMVTKRSNQQLAEKRRIAARAVEEVPDFGAILIDSGSTLGILADTLPDQPITVITNSLIACRTLAQRESIEVNVLPGKVRKNTQAMVDGQTVEAVEALVVDTLFISSDAAGAERGLSTPHHHEASLKRAMIRSARRVVALIDHTKFAADQLIRFARWDDIDMLITNTELDPGIVAAIEATGTTVALG